MKWTQLAVIVFVAIQQSSCTIQEHQRPLVGVEEIESPPGMNVNQEIEAEPIPYYPMEAFKAHRHFSSLYHGGEHPSYKKMAKMIRINDHPDGIRIEIDEDSNQEAHLIKRQDSLNEPLEKRSKLKGALLLAGGAALGALGMKHLSKPSGGGQADPNAGVPAK
ncbi:uncharacterized protein FA14DRAFT_158308 [Meira miltonrushii]|uniref:Uncharacterized protein n=1 Tax=Meira miltonrushii TaxID=1280837 RepID=A0A316VA58_9BASI|nr:uncharacterized protein FA14DRAFT_158308 [Meira miltonrushii]PWN32385.1 hypothetical protein FA14DRAFT_158308 [Meira miltonrushii]